MKKKVLHFELYRINLIQMEMDLFRQNEKTITTDQDIIKIIKLASTAKFETETAGPKNTYIWAVRELTKYETDETPPRSMYSVSLARSKVKTVGDVVTESGIEEGVSEFEPPIADTCKLFFNIDRHLLAIERTSAILNSGWRHALVTLLTNAAYELGYYGKIEFEPIPRHEEITEAFKSFDRLTRLRLVLRLPNPELSRYAKKLYEEMEQGGVREYLQDMKNPRGLRTTEGKLPHAAVEIASAGYKKGEVAFEGYKGEKHETVKTGKTAARGEVGISRDYVRGMHDIAKTKEAKMVTSKILDEIDRVAPPPENKEKK